MFIVKHRVIFYIFSVILFILSIGAVASHGLNFGIDFKGGSILEVEYAGAAPAAVAATGTKAVVTFKANASTSTATTSAGLAGISGVPTTDEVKAAIEPLDLGEAVVRQIGDHGFIIRTKSLSEGERVALVQAVGGEVKRFDSVGPVLGAELQGKAIWSIVLVILAILLFITFVFRKVSEPVPSWKYGVVAIIALLHDVVIPTGVFAFLGRFGGYEIDALFVTAILVILGFSIHDTIVVFDRTRENLRINDGSGKKSFETIVSDSVSQTLTRSINTSVSTILALIVLYFLGPESIQNFALALIVGIATGTYSSIFIGSPLLVTLEKWQNKKK